MDWKIKLNTFAEKFQRRAGLRFNEVAIQQVDGTYDISLFGGWIHVGSDKMVEEDEGSGGGRKKSRFGTAIGQAKVMKRLLLPSLGGPPPDDKTQWLRYFCVLTSTKLWYFKSDQGLGSISDDEDDSDDDERPPPPRPILRVRDEDGDDITNNATEDDSSKGTHARTLDARLADGYIVLQKRTIVGKSHEPKADHQFTAKHFGTKPLPPHLVSKCKFVPKNNAPTNRIYTAPSNQLTSQPTNQPTNQPTSQASQASQPTNQPTNQPANQLTNQPTNQPTNYITN
jgi:hypothetical protein